MKADTTNRPNPVAAPTMADFTVFLADAMQQWGTVTTKGGYMLCDETAIAVLEALGNFADFMRISANSLADLMDVVNEYAVTACTMERQGKANRAHDALTRLISLYIDATDAQQALYALENAAGRFAEAKNAYTLAEYRREQEAKAKAGAVITFTEQDAAATDAPEGAETHKPETMTDNTPKR